MTILTCLLARQDSQFGPSSNLLRPWCGGHLSTNRAKIFSSLTCLSMVRKSIVKIKRIPVPFVHPNLGGKPLKIVSEVSQ